MDEEEEVMADQQVEMLNNSGYLDQDFEFIDEVLTGHMNDIQNKEAVLDIVKRAVEKGKRKIPEEMQDITLSEVKALEENFQKVIGFSSKFYGSQPFYQPALHASAIFYCVSLLWKENLPIFFCLFA